MKNTMQEKWESEKAFLEQDKRTQVRVGGIVDVKGLIDLSNKIIGFSTPQPALGKASKIVGCNCQVCRVKKTDCFVD